MLDSLNTRPGPARASLHRIDSAAFGALRSWPFYVAIGVAFIIALAVGSLIFEARKNEIDNWRAKTANITSLLAAHAELVFGGVFDALHGIAAELATQDIDDEASFQRVASSLDTHLFLRKRGVGAKRALYLGLADTHGDMIAMTSSFPAAKLNIGDREYFTSCLYYSPFERVVGRPVNARTNNQSVLTLCIPIYSRSHRVVGIALGSIRTSFFADFYNSNNVTHANEIILMRTDGVVLAGSGAVTSTIPVGAQFPNAPIIKYPDKLKDGYWTSEPAAVEVFQRPRLIAANPVSGYPVIVGATVFGDTVLKDWREYAKVLGLVSALLCLLILALGFWGGKFLHRQEAMLAQQRQMIVQESNAKEAAEKSEKAKLNFISSISHDLRTPLTSLIASVELIHDAQPEAERLKYFGLIRASAQQLLSMIDGILNFTTSDFRPRKLKAESFSLRKLIDAQVEICRATVVGKPLEFSVRIADALPERLLGYPGAIGQILMNLLSNAAKYTPAGTIAVTVVVTGHTETDTQIVLTVADTGPGISRDLLGRLFKPFVRGAEKDVGDTQGYGLGLSIAARLARSIEGKLTVESELGKGATFSLAMKLQNAPQEPLSAELAPGAPAAECRRLKALVAEDTPSISLVLRALIEKLGHDVVTVTNGQEAVEAAAAGAFDLVFMDLQMPVMNGYEAIRRIHDLPGKCGLPVIVLTGFSEDIESERLAAAKVNVFLRKPVRLADLRAAIDKISLPVA